MLDCGGKGGHTVGHTKIAVSLPEDVFLGLDFLAKRAQLPRSAIIAEALREHFGMASAEDVSRRVSEVWSSITEEEWEAEAAPLRRAARANHLRMLESEDEPWQKP